MKMAENLDEIRKRDGTDEGWICGMEDGWMEGGMEGGRESE